jgi:hypothetical protein
MAEKIKVEKMAGPMRAPVKRNPAKAFMYWAIEKSLDGQDNLLKSFLRTNERDRWVNEKPDIREMILADTPLVRKARKLYELEGPCEIPYYD